MRVFLGLCACACLVGFGIFFATRPTQGQGQKQRLEEPTLVQRGQATEKERGYSKEFKKLYVGREGKKLGEISKMANSRGLDEEIRVIVREGTIPTFPADRAEPISDFLQSLSCQADAIIVGKPLSSTAHLLDDESFVYTEYEFTAENIFKNNAQAPFESGSNIAVSRPGGLVKLEGQLIRAGDERFDWLEKKQTYLLFLKYVPEANGYVATIPKGDFALDGTTFKKMWGHAAPQELDKKADAQSFMAEVQKAVFLGCSDTNKGVF